MGIYDELAKCFTKDSDNYFYYEGDFKSNNLTAEQLLKEAQRLINIAKKYDGKTKSLSFGFISGDIYRLYLNGQKEFAKNPQNNKIGQEILKLSKEASKIAKRNMMTKDKEPDKYVVKNKNSGEYLGKAGPALGSLSEAKRFTTIEKAWASVKELYDKPTAFALVRVKDSKRAAKDSESIKVPRSVVQKANAITQKYSKGYIEPKELQNMYKELSAIGVEPGLISGGRKMSEWYYNGKEVENSYFIYQVHKGQGSKNEYNIYFS